MRTRASNERLTDWFARYRRWRAPLRKFLSTRWSLNASDLDDVAQEVFLRLLRYDNSELIEHPLTIRTGAGERREVTLVDGSVVRLSPNTTLRVHFTEQERWVQLSHGDAVFRVAKNRAKPFLVETDHARVGAVGTEFGVEYQENVVIVTVEEGRVAVTQPATGLAPLARALPQIEVSLGADQQVVVPQAGPMGSIRKVDSRRELSWADGRLVFEQEPVAEVAKRFNRYNRVQIQIRDPKLAARPVSAVFDASDPEAFIAFLESVANVRVTRSSSDMIVITSEGPT